MGFGVSGGGSTSENKGGGSSYKPQNEVAVDQAVNQLMATQANQSNPYGQYSGTSAAMLQQYYNMMGLPNTTQGTSTPSTTTQTLNPAYTAWQQQQAQQAQQPVNEQTQGRDYPAEYVYPSSTSNPAPEQYLSTTTPGTYTAGTTVQPTGVNYSDMLNKYLTGAFDNSQNDVYNQLLTNTRQGARSAASARGLNTSGYGAGLENEAVRQMNLSWAADTQNRQQTALQNYLSGQTGVQGIGQNALSTATALEGLKQGYSQQNIANYLAYLGLGTTAQNPANSSSTEGHAGMSFGAKV